MIICPPATMPAYERDAERCLAFDVCTSYDDCPVVAPPKCAEGYTLASLRANDMTCAAFACDPTLALP